MSYQVLARKWRPKTFEEVVGQDHVVKALKNSLDNSKIHHAYLLTGTRGVGKTTIARILTKSLNCEEGLRSIPCNTCSSCLSISEGKAIDFQEVDAASRRGVEETQQLLETVMHMPGSARYKVYLIDEVHMLTKHSFNALLKTLEEPPPQVIFILATTEPENIPATVLSICLQFNLKNVPPEILSQHIQLILNEEKVSFDDGGILQIVRAGKGSIRDCLTLLDQAIVYCEGDITNTKVSLMLGTLAYDEVYLLLTLIIKKDAKELFKKLKLIAEISVDYKRLLDLILEAIQTLTVAQIEPKALDNIPIDKDEVINLSQEISAEDNQVLYQIGLIAKRDLDLSPDLSSGFEMALLRMMFFMPNSFSTEEQEDLNTSKDLSNLKEIKAPEKIVYDVSSSESESIEKKNTKTERDILLDKEEIKEESSSQELDLIDKNSWNDLFLSLDLVPGTKQLISHCSFLKIEDSVVYFSIPEERLDLLTGKHRKEFQDSLSRNFNKEINIFYEVSKDLDASPNALRAKEKIKKEEDLEKSIKEDPNVQSILKGFDATIVKDSIKDLE